LGGMPRLAANGNSSKTAGGIANLDPAYGGCLFEILPTVFRYLSDRTLPIPSFKIAKEAGSGSLRSGLSSLFTHTFPLLVFIGNRSIPDC